MIIPTAPPVKAKERNEVISYQKLRTFIGIIGFFLPGILVLGCCVFGYGRQSLQPSISHYFYTHMHIVFVGALCILGGFLITYKGNKAWESRTSNLAGFCAFGVAAFPTKAHYSVCGVSYPQYFKLTEVVTDRLNNLHFGFAGVLFICFIAFCWNFFQINDITKSRLPDPNYNYQQQIKFKRRKKFYKVCGWGIAISLVLLKVFMEINHRHPYFFPFSTFVFETTSLLFFGAAWLVKGSTYWANLPAFRWFMGWLR